MNNSIIGELTNKQTNNKKQKQTTKQNKTWVLKL